MFDLQGWRGGVVFGEPELAETTDTAPQRLNNANACSLGRYIRVPAKPVQCQKKTDRIVIIYLLTFLSLSVSPQHFLQLEFSSTIELSETPLFTVHHHTLLFAVRLLTSVLQSPALQLINATSKQRALYT
jgi:hypothetical protein